MKGATYKRNCNRSGTDHFSRLYAAINDVIKDVPRKSKYKNIDDMVEIYAEAFGGCMMINAMGSKIGYISSYHIMLRRWMKSIHGPIPAMVDKSILKSQRENFEDFLQNVNMQESAHLIKKTL